MKKRLFFLFALLTIFRVQGQPPVYFNFVSHNEETGQWNGAPFYTANRAKLITLTDYFNTKGITWNMQSDWVYLTNVLSKEIPALMMQTNNKNILRWMSEDKGVEMDPHAHESQYLYPDVVKLMDSIGLAESKVIGGTIYNDSNGVNIWTNLVNGQYGLVFPSKFWKPDYMMGGGTPNHIADLKYYGFWHPKSPINYLTNDTSVHLTHLGVGCTMKITDTTNATDFANQLHALVQQVQGGYYPANGFYIQTLFFEQADLNTPSFYNKLIEIADSADAIVHNSNAEWKTFKQAYSFWETTYAKQAFQWACGQMATEVSTVAETKNRLIVFPNPAGTVLSIANLSPNYPTKLTDLTGKLLYMLPQQTPTTTIDISKFVSGVYLLENGPSVVRFLKD
jgi:hypothetical protein